MGQSPATLIYGLFSSVLLLSLLFLTLSPLCEPRTVSGRLTLSPSALERFARLLINEASSTEGPI